VTIQWKKSTCPYCGPGCGLMVGVKEGKVVQVRGIKGHLANDRDLLCWPTMRRSLALKTG